MKQPNPLISPQSIARMLASANQCFNNQDYQQCIDILKSASRLDPNNVNVLLELGRVHGMRYEYPAAEMYLDRAVSAAPKAQKVNALAMAGLHARNFRRYELATRYLERAAGSAGAPADTLVKLAELYERIRRLDDASNLVDRALQIDPKCALALLVRSRLDRLAGKLDQAEASLRSFLDKTDPRDWSTRIRGWYELGAVLDRQQRFDEAMQAFVRAKQMVLPNAAPHASTLRSVRAQMKQAAEQISAEVLRRWHEAGSSLCTPPRRLALLCGHPRSGTTLLEQVLDSHPQIISAEETDILNFEAYCPLWRGFDQTMPVATVLESVSLDALRKSRDDYFRFMELFLSEPIGQRTLIDKNPSLTTFPPVIARIFPEMKFLVALRDPRDVCLSCFMQPMLLNPITSAYLSLEGAAAEYAAVMGLWRTFSARMPNPYLQIRYEDVVEDLETQSRRALEFLGVDWDPRVLEFNQHAGQRLVRSPTYADVAKPIYKSAVGRWRAYEKYLQPCLATLEPFVKAFGYE